MIRTRRQIEFFVDRIRVAVVGFGPTMAFGIGRLGRDVGDGRLAVFALGDIENNARAGGITVVAHRGGDDFVRARDGRRFGDHHRRDRVVAVIVGHVRAVGATLPEHVEKHLVAVGVFPTREDNRAIVEDGGLVFVLVGEGDLLDLVALGIAAVEDKRWHVAAAMTTPVTLASRRDEHDIAIGHIARVVVFNQDGGPIIPGLQRVARGPGQLANPRTIEGGFVEEVAAMVSIGESLGVLVVAKAKHDLLGVEVEVGVSRRADGQFSLEERGRLGVAGFPVGHNREPRPGSAMAAQVLIAVVRIGCRGVDVHQDLFKVQGGVRQDDVAAEHVGVQPKSSRVLGLIHARLGLLRFELGGQRGAFGGFFDIGEGFRRLDEGFAGLGCIGGRGGKQRQPIALKPILGSQEFRGFRGKILEQARPKAVIILRRDHFAIPHHKHHRAAVTAPRANLDSHHRLEGFELHLRIKSIDNRAGCVGINKTIIQRLARAQLAGRHAIPAFYLHFTGGKPPPAHLHILGRKRVQPHRLAVFRDELRIRPASVILAMRLAGFRLQTQKTLACNVHLNRLGQGLGRDLFGANGPKGRSLAVSPVGDILLNRRQRAHKRILPRRLFDVPRLARLRKRGHCRHQKKTRYHPTIHHIANPF